MSSLSFIGSHLLSLALPSAFFSLLFYGIGHFKNRQDLIVSAARANWLTFLLLSGCVLVLEMAFLGNDYSISYVYRYSSASLPVFFKITGLWAGLDGSILFWTWLVSLYAVIVLVQNKDKNPDWMPYLNGVMMAILMFFLSLMLFANNPFTPATQTHLDGQGLNPLLQNIAMVVHPPSLYLGFTGFSVPFAFVMAALMSGRVDSSWIEASRRWTIIAWFFLTLGLILGGAWAYVELGWGGFWAWDPVENAALIPWLTATAYLHSVMIQKKRGMLMVWNVSLVILTFLLTIFGTYLTRSGVVQSVHAFSEGNLGPFFLAFMLAIFVFGFSLVVMRLDHLKPQQKLQSFFSKESAFLLNNVALLVSAFAVIWGTMFPTLSEWAIGERISVGPPFFNQIMAPMGLLLLFLMGIGPMISWKKARPANVKRTLTIPFVFGVLMLVVALIMGLRQWYVLGSVMAISFVLATLYLEFYRGIKAAKKQQDLGVMEGLMFLLVHSNRRYGAYIVHLGVLLIFMGIAGAVFQYQKDLSLVPGDKVDFRGYGIQYIEPLLKEDDHKTVFAARLHIFKGDQKIDELMPSRHFYRTQEQPTTEVDVYQTFLEDLYVLVGNIDTNTKRADFRVTLNPLISFIWFGGVVILLGVVIILLPKTTTVAAATKKLILLPLLVFGLSGEVSAESLSTEDHVMEVASELMCMCGTCVRRDLKNCTCGFATQERDKILALINQGLSDEDIKAVFVKEYGMPVLTVPPEKGFFNIGYQLPGLVLLVAVLASLIFLKKKAQPLPDKPKTPSSNNSYVNQLKAELKEYDDF